MNNLCCYIQEWAHCKMCNATWCEKHFPKRSVEDKICPKSKVLTGRHSYYFPAYAYLDKQEMAVWRFN